MRREQADVNRRLLSEDIERVFRFVISLAFYDLILAAWVYLSFRQGRGGLFNRFPLPFWFVAFK